MKNTNKENPDVLFVIPPVLRFLERSSAAYPLGFGYLVSYLKQRGIYSKIYNADVYLAGKEKSLARRTFEFVHKKLVKEIFSNVDFAKKWPSFYQRLNDLNAPAWREVRSTLRTISPRIVGFGSKVVDIPSTLICAQIAKEVIPDVKIVVGGPSATTCSDYLMANETIDYLVKGEGEETVTELARWILEPSGGKNAGDIQGIVYRNKQGQTVSTSPRPLIQNLDEIPFPDREAVFYVDLRGRLQRSRRCMDVLTERGCPYSCRFCCAHQAWGTKKPRFRSIQNIIDELVYLTESYNQKEFVFWDDLFTVKRARAIELCQRIIQEKLNIRWVSLARIDTIDPELLEIMKQAGCCEIQVGIESGSDRILRYIKKGITLETIRKQAPVIANCQIPWRIFLIIGFPTETKEEIQATIDIISELRPTQVDMSIFCPYPGCELFDELQQANALGPDFMKSDTWYPYNNYTGTMSDKEFEKLGFKAFAYVDQYNRRTLK